jgi:uncharacterized paraquat-inducible protein A
MILNCPHCQTGVEVAELRRHPGTGGGYECPTCKKMVRFAQPHALFRRTISLLMSCGVLLVFGVRKPIVFAVGSLLLWLPMSIAVNMYCVYAMPLGLKPWTQRGRIPFDAGPLELFNRLTKSSRGDETGRR